MIELLILQHPLEVHQAKGSARLLHLSMPGSRMVCGETFDQEELRALLYEGAAPLLLYPQETAGGGRPLALPPVPAAEVNLPVRMVVLDATWRKSRKMLYQNQLLQQLPRLALDQMPASRYLIRKAHKPDQLSTLEAGVYAMMRLEQGQSEKYQALLAAFSGFVAQQAGYAGRAID